MVVSEWQHTWGGGGGGGGGRGAWGFQSGLGKVSRGSAVEETIGYGRWMNGRWQQRSGNGCMGRQYHHGDGRCQQLLAAGKDKTTKMQRITMSTKSSASTSGVGCVLYIVVGGDSNVLLPVVIPMHTYTHIHIYI